jgi:hypothetical protein
MHAFRVRASAADGEAAAMAGRRRPLIAVGAEMMVSHAIQGD